MNKEKLLQKTAEEMVKPRGEQLVILRKYFGNAAVDTWEQSWVDDKDLPDGVPDVINDAREYRVNKKLRKREI